MQKKKQELTHWAGSWKREEGRRIENDRENRELTYDSKSGGRVTLRGNSAKKCPWQGFYFGKGRVCASGEKLKKRERLQGEQKEANL